MINGAKIKLQNLSVNEAIFHKIGVILSNLGKLLVPEKYSFGLPKMLFRELKIFINQILMFCFVKIKI